MAIDVQQPLPDAIQGSGGLAFGVIEEYIEKKGHISDDHVDEIKKIRGFYNLASQFDEDAKTIRDMERSQRPEDKEVLEHFYGEEEELMERLEEAAVSIMHVYETMQECKEKTKEANSNGDETRAAYMADATAFFKTIWIESLYRFQRAFEDVSMVSALVSNLCGYRDFENMLKKAVDDEPAIDKCRTMAKTLQKNNIWGSKRFKTVPDY